MEFDPQKLEAILDMLVTSGVEEFEGFGFHVKFTPNMFTPEREVQPVPQERQDPRTAWENPNLWPGGKPPTFPK